MGKNFGYIDSLLCFRLIKTRQYLNEKNIDYCGNLG
uniref:Uncharacterized protein n=1 Tax=Candidatus Kentrum sp. TC TaxID=2126339 RepID=A0A450Z640_9GAMM|nr:MAG: hypothetical protein BECKTC1821D_GA0114238_10737 [Candidatus Kentron sp. TC]